MVEDEDEEKMEEEEKRRLRRLSEDEAKGAKSVIVQTTARLRYQRPSLY